MTHGLRAQIHSMSSSGTLFCGSILIHVQVRRFAAYVRSTVQARAACSDADLSAINSAGIPTSLADRAQFLTILESVSTKGCMLCVLQTVTQVCGDDCIAAKLHLMTDFAVNAQVCHEPLAKALWSGELAQFQRAILAREPFALVAGHAALHSQLADVYVPDGDSTRGNLRYRGLASGVRAYRCESESTLPRPAWVFSSEATDEVACNGILFIDLESGRAYSEQGMAATSAAPIRFDLGWADCAAFLPFPRIGFDLGVVAFETTTSTLEASCWLAFFLGPHARAPAANLAVIFSQNVTMRSDTIIRSGSVVQISSINDATIHVGPHHIEVEAGAHLHLQGLVLSGSIQSSALVVHGTAAVVLSTFIGCNATANYISAIPIETALGLRDSKIGREDSAIDSDAFSLLTVGGGIHVAPGGAIDLQDSALIDCAAAGTGVSIGGALFANSNSRARVKNCQLLRNTAEGMLIAAGGALYLHPASVVDVIGGVISGNSVQGLQALGGAAFIMVSAEMTVNGATLRRNVASGGASGANGGALLLFMGGRLSLTDSVLQHNSVRGIGPSLSLSLFSGGAIHVWTMAELLVSTSEFRENSVDGHFALYASGGAVTLSSASKASFTQVVFVGNSVFKARVSNRGGALCAGLLSVVRLRDSEFQANHATGSEPAGGAVHTDADTFDAVNVTFSHNRATASSRTANGGALCVASGRTTLAGCWLHHNVAEHVRGGLSAFGGAVQSAAGDVQFLNSRFWCNRIAGYDISDSRSLLEGPGSHVHAEGGSLLIDSCEMTDEGDAGEPITLNYTSEYWLFSRLGLLLRNSSFLGPSRSIRPLLRVPNRAVQIMIRSCTFLNISLDVPSIFALDNPIGIVDSSFDPGLDPDIPSARPESSQGCSVRLGGERLCDERAKCEQVVTGGVRCHCGEGLRATKFPDDGSECVVISSISVVLETNDIHVRLLKPSLYGAMEVEAMRVRLRLQDERISFQGFGRNISLFRPDASSINDMKLVAYRQDPVSTRVRSDGFFGTRLEFADVAGRSIVDTVVDAMLNQRKSVESVRTLQIRVNCSMLAASGGCVQDGDELRIDADFESLNNASSLRVIASVEALISCENSHVFADSTLVFADSKLDDIAVLAAIRFRLSAIDVDMQPIRYNRMRIRFLFGKNQLPYTWERGSNEYVAVASAEVTAEPGVRRHACVTDCTEPEPLCHGARHMCKHEGPRCVPIL